MEPLLVWRARNIFLHDRSHLIIIRYGASAVTQQLSECILFLLLLFIVKPPGGGGAAAVASRAALLKAGQDKTALTDSWSFAL